MSIFDRNQGEAPLTKAVKLFAEQYKTQGGDFASQERTSQFLSMESISGGAYEELQRHGETIERSLMESLENAGVPVNELNQAQKDAGLVTAMAAGDMSAYHQRAIRTDVASVEGIDVVDADGSGVHGAMDFTDKVSVESFDDQELAKHVPYSIAFNVQAARQDEFGEAFYPTVVVTPDQAGLDLHIDRTLVMTEQRHEASGKVNGWNRRSILEGIQDVSLLENNAVALVPVVLDDNSNAGKFVDPNLVAPRIQKVNRLDVKTAPLKLGEEVDLLGISEHPGLIGAGIMDSTDSIDARIGLDKLYMTMTKDVADGSGGTETVTETVAFPVNRMPRADFVKSVEGDHREMNLHFNPRDLALDPNTRTVDGTEPQLLSTLRDQDLRVRLKTNVNGAVNLETAAGKIYTSGIEVTAVFQKDAGTGKWVELSMTDTLASQAVAALGELNLIGYTLNATRSNQNLRTRGLLLNVNRKTERYTIPMGSPISVPQPLASDRSASDLSALITAARIRTSNKAVTSLLNYAETLKQYVANLETYDEDGLAIEGIGRYLVNPFYEHLELDLTQEINSITSHERNSDVKALIIDAIREITYRMYRDTNYQAAIDALSGTAGQKPKLIIGTDRTIANHIMIAGDSRTAGIDFDYQIVSSDDKRMFGKIVFSFVRPNAPAGDPLSFGTHAWVPELTSSAQVTRQGATIKETIVQPRSRHVNCLPILGEIEVKGLEVLRERVQNEATVSP